MKSTFVLKSMSKLQVDLMNRSHIGLRKSLNSTFSVTDTLGYRSTENKDIRDHKCVVKAKRPEPRDGHSTVLVEDRFMLLFGGDRHHMPFNDLLILDLSRELEEQSYLFND